MRNVEVPHVCANCLYAEVVAHEYKGVPFDIKCHRYPDYRPHDLAGWCGEFIKAPYREEMRYDLPYPPYQQEVLKMEVRDA